MKFKTLVLLSALSFATSFAHAQSSQGSVVIGHGLAPAFIDSAKELPHLFKEAKEALNKELNKEQPTKELQNELTPIIKAKAETTEAEVKPDAKTEELPIPQVKTYGYGYQSSFLQEQGKEPQSSDRLWRITEDGKEVLWERNSTDGEQITKQATADGKLLEGRHPNTIGASADIGGFWDEHLEAIRAWRQPRPHSKLDSHIFNPFVDLYTLPHHQHFSLGFPTPHSAIDLLEMKKARGAAKYQIPTFVVQGMIVGEYGDDKYIVRSDCNPTNHNLTCPSFVVLADSQSVNGPLLFGDKVYLSGRLDHRVKGLVIADKIILIEGRF